MHGLRDARLPAAVDPLEDDEERHGGAMGAPPLTLPRQRFNSDSRYRGPRRWRVGLLRPDIRRFSKGEDRTYRCRRCGFRVCARPEDRRAGYCFDCFDTLQVPAHYPVSWARSS